MRNQEYWNAGKEQREQAAICRSVADRLTKFLKQLGFDAICTTNQKTDHPYIRVENPGKAPFGVRIILQKTKGWVHFDASERAQHEDMVGHPVYYASGGFVESEVILVEEPLLELIRNSSCSEVSEANIGLINLIPIGGTGGWDSPAPAPAKEKNSLVLKEFDFNGEIVRIHLERLESQFVVRARKENKDTLNGFEARVDSLVLTSLVQAAELPAIQRMSSFVLNQIKAGDWESFCEVADM